MSGLWIIATGLHVAATGLCVWLTVALKNRSLGWVALLFGLATVQISLSGTSLQDWSPSWLTGLTGIPASLSSGLALLVAVLILIRAAFKAEHAERKARALEDEARHAAQEASSQLDASRTRLRDLTEMAPLGVFEADAGGAYTFVSDRWCKMAGLDRRAAKGCGWLDSIESSDRSRVRAEWDRAVRERRSFSCEFRLRDRTWSLVQATPRGSDSGERKGFIGFLSDISERKAIEEERRKMEVRTQHDRRLESLAVLAGGVAHDFNNLLVGVLGNAELLRESVPPDSESQRRLKLIETSASRAADLARQMLACAGDETAVPIPVDLSELALDTVRLFKDAFPEGVAPQCALESGLPPVEVDPTQLRRIVMNLVTNAVEACSEDGGAVMIRTGTKQMTTPDLQEAYIDNGLTAGHYVFVEVSDNGVGIDKQALSKVFDPFYSTKVRGRGLGLAVVLGAVRSNHGTIRIESTKGAGTNVQVLFAASDLEPGRVEEPVRPAVSTPRMGTILVVDDEPTVRNTVRAMLESVGLKVIIAAGGIEAIEIYREREQEITAVLLDMTMPEMDGEETFRRIQEVRPDVRVILYSGHTRQDAMSRFSARGLAGFLQKPFRKRDLLEALNDLPESSEPP